ncbi:NAD(P)-binding domain-containing protein [Nocardia sp. NPDC056541]|uniref:NAD(P)-binding domain-containing protein n=1 Tax=Nocardia sp. NPDC056541 TaxID=3345860 RepID=UPI00366E04AF
MSTSGRAAEAVTVIGLGPMGQQIVRTYRAAGFTVTVWNRTPGKADGLGAHRAETVADAVAAAELIVLSLTHYDAMDEILGGADLTGKVVVNLSSDSPQRTRQGAAFVRARGGEFLAGGVMAQPHEQALAIIDRSGSEIARFMPYAQRSLGSVGELYAAWAGIAEDGDPPDPAYLRMMTAGARHVVATGAEVGVDTVLAESVSSYWERSAGTPESTFQVFRG